MAVIFQFVSPSRRLVYAPFLLMGVHLLSAKYTSYTPFPRKHYKDEFMVSAPLAPPRSLFPPVLDRCPLFLVRAGCRFAL